MTIQDRWKSNGFAESVMAIFTEYENSPRRRLLEQQNENYNWMGVADCGLDISSCEIISGCDVVFYYFSHPVFNKPLESLLWERLKMTLSFTEQQVVHMIFILEDWRGDAPYDGTIKQSDNPSRKEAEKLLEKFLTPEERKERDE